MNGDECYDLFNYMLRITLNMKPFQQRLMHIAIYVGELYHSDECFMYIEFVIYRLKCYQYVIPNQTLIFPKKKLKKLERILKQSTVLFIWKLDSCLAVKLKSMRLYGQITAFLYGICLHDTYKAIIVSFTCQTVHFAKYLHEWSRTLKKNSLT